MLKIFAGKTPTERNKVIALIVLVAMTLLAIFYNIVNLYPKSKTSVTVSTASPTPTASVKPNLGVVAMPNQREMDITYTTTPVFYKPGDFYAPDAGRNIFAFYEPPLPTPYVPPPPTPFKTPTPLPPPAPAPTPPILVAFVSPQSAYAGSKTFRIEVNGDKFTTDSVINFNGNQLPTTFVSAQKLVADVPSNFIAGEGGATVTVTTPGGLFSNPFQFAIQAPPRPAFRYIGLIARKRANNDTAYFEEQGKPQPFGARLNDVVAGRFRLSSISTNEVVFEDVNLGFRHRLALYRPAPGQSGTGFGNAPVNNQNPYNPYNTVAPPPPCPPGIPCNTTPQYVPPPQPIPAPQPNDDDDDGED